MIALEMPLTSKIQQNDTWVDPVLLSDYLAIHKNKSDSEENWLHAIANAI